MPSTLPERDDQGSAEEYSETCKIHTNETLKFFCPDHEAFECGVCIVLDHRACSVQFVPDAAKGFSNTPEYKDQIHMLEEIQNDIQTCVDTVEERSASANDVHLVALGDLKKFRKEINEYLDETERDIESSAEHLKDGVDEKIGELRNKYVEIKGRADKSKQTIDLASSDEVRLFMTSKRSGKDIERLKLSVDKLKKTCQLDDLRYKFKPSSIFEKILILKRKFGKMTVTTEEENDAERDTNEDELDLIEDENGQIEGDLIASGKTSFCPSGLKDILVISDDDVYEQTNKWCQECKSYICLRTFGEIHFKETHIKRVQYPTCNIVGMAVPSPGYIVVADNQCRSVKLVDTSNSKVLARYSTASYPMYGDLPYDVTVVSNEKIAVIYSGDSTGYLRIISAENNSLAILCQVIIPTFGYVFYNNCQFYLSSASCISVRDDKIKDAQIRNFEIKGNASSRKPVLSVSDGNVFYIPDYASWNSYTLRKVSLDGTILSTYTDWDFQTPGVVTSVGDGTILLYINDKQELFLMSENCEMIKSVMKFKEEDGIKNITTMTFCSETKTLFVGENNSSTIKAIHFT
ncbi:uncharacterized protein LOC128205404 isoform X4 [Mya arenaria]|nr:uncharacterized protein LOC128205404 isoform X4 [Mya arenaria]